MDDIVAHLYKCGHTDVLIATAQGAGILTHDSAGARDALRLLARLGDADAEAFCLSAPEACPTSNRDRPLLGRRDV